MKLSIAYTKRIMSKSYKLVVVTDLALNTIENNNMTSLELNKLNGSQYYLGIATDTFNKWLGVYIK